MAKKKTKKELTEQEKLEIEKKQAWKKFQKLNYDELNESERKLAVSGLYETISAQITHTAEVSYNFWEEYENSDALKPINVFKNHVEHTLANIPQTPTKESWLDRTRGIIPNMKREWKAKVEPFKNERTLRERITKRVQEVYNRPENKGKNFVNSMPDEIEKALKDIEDNLYMPTRAKIEAIEKEILKKLE